MIIDTNKQTDEELDRVGHLLSEGLRPNDKGEWDFDRIQSFTIEYNEIFKDGYCQVKFGENFDYIHFNGEQWREKDIYKKKLILSLKGLPKKCDNIRIHKYTIHDIDYLPVCDTYDITSCRTKIISYPFPDKVNSLYICKNFIKNFNNFPKEVNHLVLEGNSYKTAEGIPVVNETLSISDNRTLVEIDEIKGNLFELNLTNLSSLQSLKNIPSTVKSLMIHECEKLDDISGVLNLEKDAEIHLKYCANIDLYTLFKSKATVITNGSTPNNQVAAYLVYKELGVKIEKMSRVEFEEAILNNITFSKSYKMLDITTFRTKEAKDKIKLIHKSLEGVEKFNL